MKIRLLSLLTLFVTSCSLPNNLVTKNEIVVPKDVVREVTVGEMASMLKEKKEHYPFSDEFIEKYQQTDDGYIDYAKSLGLVVDKTLHEPNQKWHFFDSWFDRTEIDLQSSAKTNIYNRLLCPELLLWIYEASEIDPNKVHAAKVVAEQGKVAGTAVATIAKNMRVCVPFEDINNNVLEYLKTK